MYSITNLRCISDKAWNANSLPVVDDFFQHENAFSKVVRLKSEASRWILKESTNLFRDSASLNYSFQIYLLKTFYNFAWKNWQIESLKHSFFSAAGKTWIIWNSLRIRV